MKLLWMLFSLTFLFSEEKIYLLHVPKTGGITLNILLRDQYTDEQRREFMGFMRFYGRHLSYYQAKALMKECKFITFLREPIARVLSDQQFCMELHHGFSQILKGHFLPTTGEPINTASNVACKMLSGLDPEDPEISIKQHLESAKKTLSEEIYFVGITEKMNESIEILYHWLGWQLPEEIPFYNANKLSKKSYPQEVLDGIAERNWADIELYEYALKLFEEQKKCEIYFELDTLMTEKIDDSKAVISALLPQWDSFVF